MLMAHVISFHTKDPHPVVLLPKFESEEISSLSFRFYVFTAAKSNRVPLFSSKDISIYLGHQNSLSISICNVPTLVCPHVPLNCWNTISLTSSQLHFNAKIQDFIHGLNLRKLSTMTIGSDSLCALVEIPQFNYIIEHTEVQEHTEIVKPAALASMDEISTWRPVFQGNISRVPLRRMGKNNPRELLSCHDCCDNYKFDVEAHHGPPNYRYLHWARSDIFVYFSHKSLSIPPVGWTECAHRNGTMCLGTFITEGEAGIEENKHILQNGEHFAMKLVEIMIYHNFDGYLINIESDVEDATAMADWVRLLTVLAHSAKQNSLIIWYDSLVSTGKVRWQSVLNQENLQFMQACDGFFTDYHWKKGMPAQSAALAGHHQWKVYTGTDVYGRGTYGGGEYSTRVGVENCQETSAALFAPGWTWERAGHRDYPSFLLSEKMLWAECSTPIVDSGGAIFPSRPELNKHTLLQGWSVDICDSSSLDSPELGWARTSEASRYWSANDDLTMTSSFVLSRRSVYVDLKKLNKKGVNYVTGSVEVRGTGPKFDDFYIVALDAIDSTGKRHITSQRGRATEQWKTITLELSVNDIQAVTWEEAGKDEEYWQGFYGSTFRNTYVVIKEAGQSILENFEVRTHLELISTWFNLGQGPRLFRKGEVIQNSIWNSLQDCDIIPDYTVFLNNHLNTEHVYHGTSSMLMKNCRTVLFHTDFVTNETNIKIVYMGVVKLLLDGTELIKEEISGTWKIDYYKHTGHVRVVEVSCTGKSYLAGIHFYNSDPCYQIEIIKKKYSWNRNSLECEEILVDLEIQINEIPHFIRHIDAFHGQEFVSRAYSNYFVVREVISEGVDVVVRLEAEDLKGDIASTVEITIPYAEIISAVPIKA